MCFQRFARQTSTNTYLMETSSCSVFLSLGRFHYSPYGSTLKIPIAWNLTLFISWISLHWWPRFAIIMSYDMILCCTLIYDALLSCIILLWYCIKLHNVLYWYVLLLYTMYYIILCYILYCIIYYYIVLYIVILCLYYIIYCVVILYTVFCYTICCAVIYITLHYIVFYYILACPFVRGPTLDFSSQLKRPQAMGSIFTLSAKEQCLWISIFPIGGVCTGVPRTVDPVFHEMPVAALLRGSSRGMYYTQGWEFWKDPPLLT